MLRKIWVLALIGILSVASIHAQDEVQENSVSINSTWVKIWSRQVKQKHYTGVIILSIIRLLSYCHPSSIYSQFIKLLFYLVCNCFERLKQLLHTLGSKNLYYLNFFTCKNESCLYSVSKEIKTSPKGFSATKCDVGN